MPLCENTIGKQKITMKGNTYCSSILHDVLDIARCVNFLRRVCTIDGELGILCDFEWKTLTIRDMPVESVDLYSS
jgi:hypothetical protein